MLRITSSTMGIVMVIAVLMVIGISCWVLHMISPQHKPNKNIEELPNRYITVMILVIFIVILSYFIKLQYFSAQ